MYVYASLLFYLITGYVYHSIFRRSSNALQISSLRCGHSECSQLNVLLMVSLLKRNISHLLRKCPIGLPIWNSLSFLMITVASGSESVGNGSFVTKRNSHLGLHRGHRGEVTTYMTRNQRYDLDINTCRHSACHSRTSSRSRQNMLAQQDLLFLLAGHPLPRSTF